MALAKGWGKIGLPNLYLFPPSSGKDKNKSILQVRDAEGRAPLKRLTSLGPFPHTPCPVPFPPYPQNKYVRCSVRAEVRHLRRVLCHRLMLNPQHVSIPTVGFFGEKEEATKGGTESRVEQILDL